VSVSRSVDGNLLVAYLLKSNPIKLYNLNNYSFAATWFNPVSKKITTGKVATKNGTLHIIPPAGVNNLVLVLKKKHLAETATYTTCTSGNYGKGPRQKRGVHTCYWPFFARFLKILLFSEGRSCIYSKIFKNILIKYGYKS
jgi:hypothetical protein